MRNENDYSIQRRSIIAVGLLVCLCSAGWTQWTEEQDAAYMNRFHDHFRKWSRSQQSKNTSPLNNMTICIWEENLTPP